MERRTSASARIFAALALVGAVIVVIVAIASSSGGSSSSSSNHHPSAHASGHKQQPQKQAPAVYVVKTGDTLTSIAHENGVPIARILALNPEVDPQILTAGEKLKLR
jgi:LysM repeat protein